MAIKATMATSHAEVITPELLDSLRSHPDLPDDAWYLVVVTALCVLNRPEGIPMVYTHAVDTRASSGSSGHGTTINGAEVVDEREQLRIARRMREALLKTSAIGGLPKVRSNRRAGRWPTKLSPSPPFPPSHASSFPASCAAHSLSVTRYRLLTVKQTINALQELRKVVPAHMLDEPPQADGEGDAPSPTNRRRDVYATPTSTVLERGRAFFDKCYGKVAGRVMTSLDHSGTEDLGLAVRLTYGYVLSTTAILAEAETSFVMIAGLIPQDVSFLPTISARW